MKQNAEFRFNRTLEDKNLFPEIGDIIFTITNILKLIKLVKTN